MTEVAEFEAVRVLPDRAGCLGLCEQMVLLRQFELLDHPSAVMTGGDAVTTK